MLSGRRFVKVVEGVGMAGAVGGELERVDLVALGGEVVQWRLLSNQWNTQAPDPE